MIIAKSFDDIDALFVGLILTEQGWVGVRRSNFRRSKDEIKSFFDQEIKSFCQFSGDQKLKEHYFWLSISWKISWLYLWPINFSGNQKFILTFDLLIKVTISWKIITEINETFDLLKNVTFDLLIVLLTSWKMPLSIYWNSTSWSFPTRVAL